MRIGDIAHRAGVSTRALRYYEEQGLIRSERTASGQRQYDADVIGRVRLIQVFYGAGLPSKAIARILPSVDSGVTTPETLRVLGVERDRIAAAIGELEQALSQLDMVMDHASNTNHDPGSCRYVHQEDPVQHS